MFVACGGGEVRVLDATTGVDLDVLRGHSERVQGIAITRDGQWLVTSGLDREIRIWNLASAAAARVVRAHKFQVSCADTSPDGLLLVTGGDGAKEVDVSGGGKRMEMDQTVRIWDVRTGRLIRTLAYHRLGRVSRVRFSPDGRWLVSAGRDGQVACWDAQRFDDKEPPKPTWTAALYPGLWGADDVNFSPDGQHLVTAGWSGAVEVRHLASGARILRIPTPVPVTQNACYRPDGRTLTVSWYLPGDDGHLGILFYDSQSGAELRRLSDPVVSYTRPAYSRDGKVFYAATGVTVRTWDADSGQPLPIAFKGYAGAILSVATSPDGTRLLTASDDGTARVWDAATGNELLALRGHAGRVWEARFTADGNAIVTAGADGTVRIWAAPGGENADSATLAGTSWVAAVRPIRAMCRWRSSCRCQR